MKDKLFSKSKFPWILGGTALLIALCAAFFSVYGISTLFAGASVSAMVMASSLEIGKLVGTTFLYRYWRKCNGALKIYLMTSIIVLMVITSLGIFGYLSSAYQKSSIEFGVAQEKIKTTEEQKTYYQDKISASKERIKALQTLRSSQESRMSETVTNQYLTRNPLQLKQIQQQTIDLISSTDKDIKDENDKVQASIDNIEKIGNTVNQLKLGTAERKDVQIFKFVADAFGVSLDKVARYFTGMLIFVFDPLAVCLILAYNVAVYKKEDKDVYDDIRNQTIVGKEVPKVLPETETKEIQQTTEIKDKTSTEAKEEFRQEEKKQVITDAKVEHKSEPFNDTFFKSYFKK